MSKKYRDPRRKKILSYSRDTRMHYGENKKSSRIGVRRRKAGGNRSFRRSVHQALSDRNEDPDILDHLANSANRKRWKKYPDKTVVDSLDSTNRRKFKRSTLRAEAIREVRNRRGFSYSDHD